MNTCNPAFSLGTPNIHSEYTAPLCLLMFLKKVKVSCNCLFKGPNKREIASIPGLTCCLRQGFRFPTMAHSAESGPPPRCRPRQVILLKVGYLFEFDSVLTISLGHESEYQACLEVNIFRGQTSHATVSLTVSLLF
jgi:hypothetical protein